MSLIRFTRSLMLALLILSCFPTEAETSWLGPLVQADSLSNLEQVATNLRRLQKYADKCLLQLKQSIMPLACFARMVELPIKLQQMWPAEADLCVLVVSSVRQLQDLHRLSPEVMELPRPCLQQLQKQVSHLLYQAMPAKPAVVMRIRGDISWLWTGPKQVGAVFDSN